MLIFMLLILSWKAAPNFRQLIGHPDFELNATVMRLIFLFVAGGTLAFFGAIREQNHDRLAKLSEWPGPTAATSDEDDHTPLTAILPHVAAVIEAPRILVLWEQLEEPYTNVFLWSRERKQQDRRLGDG